MLILATGAALGRRAPLAAALTVIAVGTAFEAFADGAWALAGATRSLDTAASALSAAGCVVYAVTHQTLARLYAPPRGRVRRLV